jgi:hypothetical protein
MFLMSRQSPFLVVLFALVVLVVNACSGKKPEEDAAPSGPSRGLAPPPERPEPQEAPQQAPAQPFRFPDDTPAPTAAPAAEGQPAPAAPEGPPPRDYSGELKSLVGSPSGCLKPRVGAQAPREISVTVEAVVMESGMVSRAYARAGDLDDDELSCIRARLGSARMGGGVENAPRTVTTTISMVLQPATTPVRANQPGNEEGNAPSEPGAQPSGEGLQPEPGSAAPSGAEQQQAEQPNEAPPPAYGQPEAPANNPE